MEVLNAHYAHFVDIIEKRNMSKLLKEMVVKIDSLEKRIVELESKVNSSNTSQ